jgi:hypothetical protein
MGHVARVGGMRNAYKIFVGKPNVKGRGHSENPALDGTSY